VLARTAHRNLSDGHQKQDLLDFRNVDEAPRNVGEWGYAVRLPYLSW
jgi:hypothetical protein